MLANRPRTASTGVVSVHSSIPLEELLEDSATTRTGKVKNYLTNQHMFCDLSNKKTYILLNNDFIVIHSKQTRLPLGFLASIIRKMSSLLEHLFQVTACLIRDKLE